MCAASIFRATPPRATKSSAAKLLIDEGDIFNTHLWELSILRLNQLGYFEVLKEDEAADIKRDTKTDTVTSRSR